MQGWIKLHRKILFSNMYRSLNSKQRDVMITCLLLANHSENEWEFDGNIYECKPGQFVTSLQKIADFCGNDVKVQSVRTALLKLEKWQFLTNKSTKQNRLITICKWDTYQQKELDTNKDTNSQPTDDQQTTNNQLTTNKNVKKEKNENNKKGDDDFSYLFDILSEKKIDGSFISKMETIYGYSEDRIKREIQECLKDNPDLNETEKIKSVVASWIKKSHQFDQKKKEEAHNDIFRVLYLDQKWIEGLAMKYKGSVKDIQKHLDRFRQDLILKETLHEEIKSAKSHFINWVDKGNDIKRSKRIMNT
jgi:hypothetical protein